MRNLSAAAHLIHASRKADFLLLGQANYQKGKSSRWDFNAECDDMMTKYGVPDEIRWLQRAQRRKVLLYLKPRNGTLL